MPNHGVLPALRTVCQFQPPETQSVHKAQRETLRAISISRVGRLVVRGFSVGSSKTLRASLDYIEFFKESYFSKPPNSQTTLTLYPDRVHIQEEPVNR